MRESLSIVPIGAAIALRDREDHRIPADALAMLVDLACDFAVADSTLYQLGMQVTDILPRLHDRLGTSVHFIGTDRSSERARRIRHRLGQSARERHIELQRVDLNRGIALRNACVAILPHAARDLRPLRRSPLVGDIYRGLRDGGCALVVETVRGRDSLLNNIFASHTQDQWRDGPRSPSDEIAGAGTIDEERTLLMQAGFRSVEVFYKRYGVCGLIGVK